MTIGDVKHSLILWASGFGIYDIEPSESLNSEAQILSLPLTSEHAGLFKYRKIFRIKQKGEVITIATKMAVSKDKTNKLKDLLENHFSDLRLKLEFTIEKEFKVDQKVRPTLNPLY